MCMHCFNPAMTSLFLAPCILLVTHTPRQPSAPCSVALPFLTHGPLCLSPAGQDHFTTKSIELSYGTEPMKPAAKPLKPSASSYSGCQRAASLTQSPKDTTWPWPHETTFLSPRAPRSATDYSLWTEHFWQGGSRGEHGSLQKVILSKAASEQSCSDRCLLGS